MSKNLFALLIGINKYPADSNVSDLDGCENDVLLWQKFLEKQFPEEKRSVVPLVNEKATRQNVIKHFGNDFLLKATEDDMVLIAYSGHGSREIAAPEFARYFPDGKGESLVLYDSRTTGGYDLADKELAVLIERIALKGAHVVVVLDCCHAGSGTKNADDFLLGKPRQTSNRTEPRPIDTYLEGTFLKNDQGFYLPNSRHILLAACDRKEKAYETASDRGLFSLTIHSILERTGGRLSYADLFTQCRIEMARTSDQQHPQFEPSGFFNAYQGFLGLHETQTTATIRVYYEKDRWEASVGALHGLPILPETPATFEVRQGDQIIGQIRSKVVGMQTSTLVSPDFELDENVTYEAHLTSLPVPKMAVEWQFDPAVETQTKEMLKFYEPVYFVFQDTGLPASYQVQFDVNEIRLIRCTDDTTLFTIKGNQRGEMLMDLMEKLEKIGKWEKFMSLENPNSKINDNSIDLSLVELDELGNVLRTVSDGEAILEIKAPGQKAPYRIELQNKSESARYCALIYAGSDYGLAARYNNELPKSEKPVYAIDKRENGEQVRMTLSEGKTESINYFKLIVSNKPFLNESLGQKGFAIGGSEAYFSHRSVDEKALKARDDEEYTVLKPMMDKNDWYVITLKIKTIARTDMVGKDAFHFANRKIYFKEHVAFSADVSLRAIGDSGRSMDDMSLIAALAKHGDFKLIQFKDNSRSATPVDMIELTGLSNEDSLLEQPLEIEIAEKLEHSETHDEFLMALTLDGEQLVPVGETEELENGNTQFRIRHLPTSVEKRSRNPVKALKMCFVKLVFWKHDVNKLCWVDYSQAKVERRAENLYNKVLASDRILLLIHGIIGDTKGMAESMRSTVENDDFDLVLTYDYENLNTKIEATAGILADKLLDAGIKAGGKKITILAHSMGGLVARYFIENLQGNKVTEHLVMAGTPNAGSRISNLTHYRDCLMPLLALAINLPLGISMSVAASILALMQQSKIITPTLEQMDYDHSDSFLKNLGRSSDPHVPYTIVAGNLHNYLTENEGQLKFKDKLIKLGGKLFYRNQPNDVAVSIDSILAVPLDRRPKPESLEVPCHHLNYFNHKAAINPIIKLLKK